MVYDKLVESRVGGNLSVIRMLYATSVNSILIFYNFITVTFRLLLPYNVPGASN